MDEQQTRKQIPKSTASGPQFFFIYKTEVEVTAQRQSMCFLYARA